MKNILCALSVMLALAFSGLAFADEDCDAKYAGTSASLPEADARFLANALSLIKNKKRSEMLAISEKKLVLVRRYVSGGVDARGGNLEVKVTHKQIDKNLDVHVPPMRLPEYLDSGATRFIRQPAQEEGFTGDAYFPETDGKAVILNRAACGEDKKCDFLPFGPDLEELVSGLLHCNADRHAAYVFTDGLLISDMELIPWPIGEAFYFSKGPSGYKLAALIIFR